MDTAELIKKVKKIEIITSHLVSDMLAGTYTSAFRGTGMEFDEVREYQVGDDIRNIDWNVTARSGQPHVKRFVEEREMTVMILVDGSSSVSFGSNEQSKLDLASEISAVLAFAATANNDKVGLILFTDKVDLYLPPKTGKAHALRLIREILSFSPRNAKTNIAEVLDFLGKVQKRRTVSFLVSDYFDDDFEDTLNITSRRHDLVAIKIGDRREEEFPAMGLVRLEDAETGEQILVDTSSSAGRKKFEAGGQMRQKVLGESFKKRSMDSIFVNTGDNYIQPLKALFKKRGKKR